MRESSLTRGRGISARRSSCKRSSPISRSAAPQRRERVDGERDEQQRRQAHHADLHDPAGPHVVGSRRGNRDERPGDEAAAGAGRQDQHVVRRGDARVDRPVVERAPAQVGNRVAIHGQELRGPVSLGAATLVSAEGRRSSARARPVLMLRPCMETRPVCLELDPAALGAVPGARVTERRDEIGDEALQRRAGLGRDRGRAADPSQHQVDCVFAALDGRALQRRGAATPELDDGEPRRTERRDGQTDEENEALAEGHAGPEAHAGAPCREPIPGGDVSARPTGPARRSRRRRARRASTARQPRSGRWGTPPGHPRRCSRQ